MKLATRKNFWKSFLIIIFMMLLQLSEYNSQTVCNVNNYWIYSLFLLIAFTSLIVVIIKYEYFNLDLMFFIPFLYIIPVMSFYTIPKVVDLVNLSAINKKDIKFIAIVDNIFYIRRADKPHLRVTPLEKIGIEEIFIRVENKDYNILKANDKIRMYGTISNICFRYDSYEKII